MYTKKVHKFNDIIEVEQFIEQCKYNMFIDEDGFGNPVKDELIDTSIPIHPSNLGSDIPPDATHIVWYNK